MPHSYEPFTFLGLAIDPIHVGTGGNRLGRVDLSIVRDPVTKVPKIPGSSLAGVMRTYVAMANEKYPQCAGVGQPRKDGSTEGHCAQRECPVCTVFGYAKGKDEGGGFAGLAAFSDMSVLLFPVPSRSGPQWITCPMALRWWAGFTDEVDDLPDLSALYREEQQPKGLNLGWLQLPVKADWPVVASLRKQLERQGVPDLIVSRVGVVSDQLFSYIVNSNLEVRTSVAIDPATGAADAETGALFTYEALPRATVLSWDVTCRNPRHFMFGSEPDAAVQSPQDVKEVVASAYHYLEHLGIGGMGSRGMGRLRVLMSESAAQSEGVA